MTTLENEVERLRNENAALKDELRQHELRLQTLVDSFPFDFWMMDEAGRYIVQNTASRQHWGQAVGAHEDVVPDPAIVAQWQNNNRRAFAGETVTSEVEYEHEGVKGHYLKLLAPVLDEGRVRAIVGVNLDVTDSRRLAMEVERNHRLESLGVLAGGIAHDFNNQLMAIVGNVSLLRREASGRTHVVERLLEVENACMAASGLARQLLTFARGGAPVRAPMAVAEVLPELVRFALRGTTSSPELVIAPGLGPAMVDAGQFQQMIHNLVLNAHEAMESGGSVRVLADPVEITHGEHELANGRYVRITVVDRGVGIRPEDLARVFEPYFTTKDHGHGLGLSIVHSIARRHGGTVVASSSPGHGTAMALYVPAAEGAPEPSPTPRAREVAPHCRVLVLDDEPALRDTLVAMFEELDCDVEAVETTDEAVARYGEALRDGRRFDLAILDLIVPGDPGGSECAKRLAELDPDAKLIVSSGYSHDDALVHPERYGFVGRLVKPFTLDELTATMQRVLDA